MSTPRQLRAVKEIIENPRQNQGDSLRNVGYSEATATHPKEVLQSKGFKEILRDIGLTDELATAEHLKLLTDEDKNIKIKALSLYYDVTGKKELAKVQVNNINVGGESLADMLSKRVNAVEGDVVDDNG